jgi:hypothetical protein
MNANTDYVDLDDVDAAIDALELAERRLKKCTERGHSEGEAAIELSVMHDQAMDIERWLLTKRVEWRMARVHRADQ